MTHDATNHAVVSREDWLTARQALLAREKEMTRLRDAINRERLALPWVKVEEDYRFETPDGEKSLSDLFDGRSQLIIYHFMFGPDWEAGCSGCSFLADHLDGTLPHLNHHDVTLVCVSRAPLDKIAAYKRRMGWRFPWVSSFNSRFNFDFGVSFTKEELASGSVFYNFRDTPTAQAHDELPGNRPSSRMSRPDLPHLFVLCPRRRGHAGTMMILDIAPKGRNEDSTMNFVKRHDEYEDQPKVANCCH